MHEGTHLSVPALEEGTSTLTAALAYAECGWYVLPVEPEDKKPAKLLGRRWQDQSSRDPEQLVDWFAGTGHAIGLHVGRSGAVVFDIDTPDLIPPVLAEAAASARPPFQSTRTSVRGRGHHVYATPPGRRLGNSRGGLVDASTERGKQWGEVRGVNGLVVVEPSEHTKPGGRYKWLTTGIVPVLPQPVSDLLPEASDTTDAVTDTEVTAFLGKHTENERPQALNAILARFAVDLRSGSRHEALVAAGPWAMREARMGHFPAAVAYQKLQALFVEAMNGERHPVSEHRGVMAWAIAQAMTEDVGTRKVEREKVLDTPSSGVSLGQIPPALQAQHEAAAQEKKDADPRRRYFHDKEAGVDIERLAADVLDQGSLAWGGNERYWAYEGGVWRYRPEVVEARCTRLLRGSFREGYVRNTERFIKHQVPHLTFDPVPQWVNLRNGLLDWRTGVMAPHSPEVLTTIQLPLDWRPDATCPRFDAFLASIAEPETVDLVWEMIGYLMMSGNPLQVAFLLHGPGENGKGTLLRTITALLGEENTSAVSLDDLNSDRFAPSGLFGKTANIAGDIDATFQETTAAFKKLTGEDPFRGQHKYGQPFDFTNWAVPLFSANKIPGSADVSKGYIRRWIVLPLDKEIDAARRVRGLSDLLAREVEGIAAKAVPALRTLMERGKFEQRGAVARAHEDFVHHIDRVRQWLEECAMPAVDPGEREERSTVYQSFRAWCEHNGMAKMSARELVDRLEGIDPRFKGTRVRGVDYVKGLHVVAFRPGGLLPAPSPIVPD